jgi:hypothetical protein
MHLTELAYSQSSICQASDSCDVLQSIAICHDGNRISGLQRRRRSDDASQTLTCSAKLEEGDSIEFIIAGREESERGLRLRLETVVDKTGQDRFSG